MRKYLLFIVALFLSTATFAQDNNLFDEGHLSFKGLPLSGSLDDYVSNLVSQGYVLKQSQSSGALLKGSFASESDCTIVVLTTKRTHQVYCVAVSFEKKTTWSSLKSQYRDYQSMLSAKYGEPSKKIERFYNPYYEGDGYELQALRLDKCSYTSFFDVSNGSVMLSMSNDGSLVLYYSDKEGNELNDREERMSAMSDL